MHRVLGLLSWSMNAHNEFIGVHPQRLQQQNGPYHKFRPVLVCHDFTLLNNQYCLPVSRSCLHGLNYVFVEYLITSKDRVDILFLNPHCECCGYIACQAEHLV